MIAACTASRALAEKSRAKGPATPKSGLRKQAGDCPCESGASVGVLGFGV